MKQMLSGFKAHTVGLYKMHAIILVNMVNNIWSGHDEDSFPSAEDKRAGSVTNRIPTG